jgi:ubiquinone/menaquinone biosynthesis C-methylase UbiE
MVNFRTQLLEGPELPFDDGSFDAIFMVTVFGEIEARDRLLAEAFRVLRVGGVLSISEHHPDPDFELASVVAREVARHGFVPGPRRGWRWAYTLNATRVG